METHTWIRKNNKRPGHNVNYSTFTLGLPVLSDQQTEIGIGRWSGFISVNIRYDRLSSAHLNLTTGQWKKNVYFLWCLRLSTQRCSFGKSLDLMFHLFSSLARTSCQTGLNEPKLQSLENKVFEFETRMQANFWGVWIDRLRLVTNSAWA